MIQKNLPVTISILTYNRSEVLKELLISLQQIRYSPLELIVIDNHSCDDTEVIVKEQFSSIRYFKTKENIGVGARNIGFSNATGEVIITLDDDIIGLNDNDILKIIDLFNSKSDVGAICFSIRDYYDDRISNWCHHYKKEDYWNKEFITDEITEGAVAFRMSALDKVGFYPEFFFISYEGVDLLCRLLNEGYKTIYSPEISVKHLTHQSGRMSWRRYYFDTRNQVWFVARNYPVLFGLKYLFRGTSAILLYSIRDGFFKFWLMGIYHGFKALPKIIKERKKINKNTLKLLQKIAANRPSLLYTIKQRVFMKEIKL